jgi:beta-glucanase (GH16 family)
MNRIYLYQIWFCFFLAACNKNNGAVLVPSISIENLTKNEGNSGVTSFEFPVSLSAAANGITTVSFSISGGSAAEGADYTLPVSFTITFQPGEIRKLIAVSVIADDIKEADEDFMVTLKSPSTATIAVATAKGVILNDDSRVLFTNAGFTSPVSYPGLTMVWSDEFNASTLNTNYWSYEIGDGCPSLCGWGNNELQYYTNSPNNLFLQNGNLVIESLKQSIGGKAYTSAKIKTDGKKSFKFGRIDIRAISPYGRGLWPTLWLFPQNNAYGTWPNSGEIDIMEVKGHDTKTAYQTVHFGPGPPSTYISKTYTLTNGSLSDSFHVYSIIWEMDSIRLLVDNIEINKITKADLSGRNYPFNEYFYLIINTAIGGNFPGDPDASTAFPQWFIVDYVRVFQ